MLKEGQFYLDDKWNDTYVCVKPINHEEAICAAEYHSPGFVYIKYEHVDDNTLKITHQELYDTLEDVLSANDFAPPELAVNVYYKCKLCGTIHRVQHHIKNVDVLKKILEAPYDIIDDHYRCDDCDSYCRPINVSAVTDYEEVTINDDVFGL